MKLGYGLMRLPVLGEKSEIDIERVKGLADRFIKAGGTYFDTAYVYHDGKSEEAFREAVVKRYPRESFTIADKLPMFLLKTREEAEKVFAEQLDRCGVDYFDYYLLHSLGEGTYFRAQRMDAFGYIAEKKKEGKIKHIGFSFHDTPELLDRILTEHPEVEFVQLQINYLDWEDVNVRSKECYETAVRHGKPVVIMEPVKGGSLADIPEPALNLFKADEPDSSAASWAIRFAAGLPGVMTVLSGMSNEEQLEDNISVLKDFTTLSEEKKQTVFKAADVIRAAIAIPCTACRYCTGECPQNIAIPEYFGIYNNLKRFGKAQTVNAVTYYTNTRKTHARASECIKCGKCEAVCPQHIEIRKYLEKIADIFDK